MLIDPPNLGGFFRGQCQLDFGPIRERKSNRSTLVTEIRCKNNVYYSFIAGIFPITQPPLLRKHLKRLYALVCGLEGLINKALNKRLFLRTMPTRL